MRNSGGRAVRRSVEIGYKLPRKRHRRGPRIHWRLVNHALKQFRKKNNNARNIFALHRTGYPPSTKASGWLGRKNVTLLPIAGLAALMKTGFKALPQRVRDVALFLAAPFIGLAYLAAFPLIGAGALVYAGVQAARGK